MKTRKNKLTNIFKIGILFFGISLLLWNCEKEEHNHNIEHQLSPIEKVDVSNNIKIQNLISNRLLGKSKKRGSSFNFDNINLDDALLFIDSLGVKSYSIQIEKEIGLNNPFTFENLQILEKTNGDTFLFIIRYEPTIKYMKNNNYIFNLKNFSGTKKIFSIDYELLSEKHFSDGFDINNNYQSRGTSCTLAFVTVSACNGVPYDCYGAICGFVDTSFEVCTYTGIGGGGDPDPSNGNNNPWSNSGGGGSGSNGNSGTSNDGVSTAPNPPTPTEDEIALSEIYDCVDDYGGLNPVLGSYLSQQAQEPHNSLAFDIQNFIDTNGCSNGTKSFIEESLEFLEQNQQYNFSQYENWFSKSNAELETNPTDVNPNDITFETPLTQQSLPTFSTFLTNFPKRGTSGNYSAMSTTDAYTLAGGSLLTSHINQNAQYNNACAIRASRGLLYSGIQIPVLKYNGSQRTQKGGDGKNYILDAVSFNTYMIAKFGETSIRLEGADANDPVKIAAFLNGKNGIYVIVNSNTTTAGYSGHCDTIINGQCISNAYTTPNGGVKSIRIWLLN